jgi:hypothetical protein
MNRLYFICEAFFGLIFLFSLGEADSMPSMKMERRSVKKSIHRVTKRHSRFHTIQSNYQTLKIICTMV